MQFGFLTINFGRPQVFRLFCASIRRLRQETGIDFPTIVVSEPEDAPTCNEYGIGHIIQKNNPTTFKWNTGAQYLKQLGCDYIVVTGSDDCWSTETLMNLVKAMETGVDLLGIKSLYAYDADGVSRGRLIRIISKNFLGVGKTIHRRVLDKVDWLPWTYHAPRNYGTDAILHRNISPYVETRAEYSGMIVDVKSKDSLNKFTMLNSKGTPCQPELFYRILSPEEKNILNSIIHVGIPIKFPNLVKKGRRIV